ncbi:MAG: hypothetical protein L0213_12255, partial [Candidatus Dadabacteria bacterium]|nr:hypothetical protein [Candidatus Dadabacteria bacterium]
MVDRVSLEWVRGEIDETVRRAQAALEAFAINPTEVANLDLCMRNLREVRGPIKMLGLNIAADLLDEMSVTVKSLKNEPPTEMAGHPAVDALMNAVLVLPNYLSLLATGTGEHGGILFPYVKDLSEARRAPPVSM